MFHFIATFNLYLKPSLFLKPILCLALLLHMGVAQALPKNISLEYEVTRNGKPFATVKETFSQGGGHYKIESTTKGIGVYALFGLRKLTSEGAVTEAGLQPHHFELHQGDNGKKSLINDFYWGKNMLYMSIKGEHKEEALAQGMQDLLSFAYQFMYAPPVKQTINVQLTTGKKINTYDYRVTARGLELAAANTVYKTTHLTDADQKQLWLAEAHHYLIVRYRQADDSGAVLEQTLTKMKVD